MAGKFTVNGTNTTITFEYTAPTTKVQAIVLAAARYFYDLDAVDVPPTTPFDSLTNQQKLDILDRHIRRLVNEAARQANISTAIAVASAAADADLAV